MSILDRREPKVALPKEWPRGAKFAIVHALALAHLVATHVRGWCADSPLKRVRLAAECERLRSEVAMLREELRIKDMRLARVPPRNRPHYPPVERLAILALKAARGWNTAQTSACFLVESATIATPRRGKPRLALLASAPFLEPCPEGATSVAFFLPAFPAKGLW